MTSDAFQEYQVQNKNFENIFNTQIKKLDDTRQLNRLTQASNILTGTAKGAFGGAMAGKDPATIAMGALTGTASGLLNMIASEENYKIDRQYSIDMYNYNLGNIKALPDTLTKISAYNVDNKYFPVVERYSCTDEEVEMLKSKLRYQSYAIMGLMTINDLPTDGDSFVKGQMVRLEAFDGDNHTAEEIYSEIAKGVYL